MSKGNYACDVHCPHCAATIPVKVSWENDPGTRLDPPYFESFLSNLDGSDVTVCESCGHVIHDGEYELLVTEAENLYPYDDEEPLEGYYDAEDDARAREFMEELDAEAEARHMGPDQ